MITNEKKKFEKFFGIKQNEVSDVLLISPFLPAKLIAGQLKQKKYFKGMIFRGVNGIFKNKKITFINTGMGQTFVTDCMLALSREKIKAVIFLGAVGAIQDFKIGDVVVLEEAFFDTQYHENFGITFQEKFSKFSPDKNLLKKSLDVANEINCDLKQANVISIHTFWDQGQKRSRMLAENKMQSVDLECALFYAASKKQNIRSVAFCYVSDNIINRPFWSEFSIKDKLSRQKSMVEMIRLGLELARKSN